MTVEVVERRNNMNFFYWTSYLNIATFTPAC